MKIVNQIYWDHKARRKNQALRYVVALRIYFIMNYMNILLCCIWLKLLLVLVLLILRGLRLVKQVNRVDWLLEKFREYFDKELIKIETRFRALARQRLRQYKELQKNQGRSSGLNGNACNNMNVCRKRKVNLRHRVNQAMQQGILE